MSEILYWGDYVAIAIIVSVSMFLLGYKIGNK